MFNEFIMTKRTLINVLRFFLKTFKTVSIKPCIHIESKNRSSQFSYTAIVVTSTMNFLEVVTSPAIYHGYSAWKTLWEEKFTLVNMKSCGRHNVRKHRKIKNGEQYITLDIYLKVDFLEKRESTYSESRDYMGRSFKGLNTSLTLKTKSSNNKQN